MNDLLQPRFQLALPVKILFNIGALLDIPTGRFVKGQYGENILLGGLSTVTGIVGHGNNFKSTLLNFVMGQLINRIDRTTLNSYDTEINIVEDRIMSMMAQLPEWNGEFYMSTGRWQITDSTMHLGDEYFDILKDFLTMKINNRKKLLRTTPFLDRDGKTLIQIPQPTGGTVDSLSEFKTSDIVKMSDDNKLGDKGGTTIFMRQGLQKKRFLTELPNILGSSFHYLGMTAHIGDKIETDARNPSVQGLQHLRVGKMKGVPDAFSFLTQNCWHCYGASILKNDGTGAPEYPRNPIENQQRGSTDLNIVRVRMLRSKHGQSGYSIELVVSQSEGILPSLSEFHYIRTRKRFGLTGNNITYQLALRPETNLGRTTVRSLLNEDARLRRAMNITAELCQMREFWNDTTGNFIEPELLYKRIKDLGYDWDQLLDTRGWWCLDNDKHPLPFLSTMDLIEMAHRRYVPYWMDDADVPEAVKHIKRKKGPIRKHEDVKKYLDELHATQKSAREEMGLEAVSVDPKTGEVLSA